MRFRLPRAAWLVPLVSLVALAAPPAPAAHAQYFGRNKVQYRTFQFKVIKTEHFDVYYYEAERAAAEQAARMAERWYTRLARVLDHQLGGRQPLILYASHPDFEQTNAIEGTLEEGTGGVTEISKRRIVLPLAATLGETDHVIGHELVHAFQFDIARQRGTGGFAEPALARLPLWFVEGMAEYLSLGPIDPHTAMWIRDAAAHDKIPTIAKLSDPRFFPYRYGQALWSYIAGRWGDRAVAQILKAAARAGGAEDAIRTVTGMRADSLSMDWQASIRAWSAPIIAAAGAPARFGRALVTDKHGGGRLNLAPALSPDGRRLVFLSERELFSIDMYLADAQTGRVIRHLTRTAVDPHFQSLQFIHSAGAWSPDGRRFAFAAVSAGRPVLTIVDENGRRERELAFDELGEIFSPTWSPDGQRIAFSAMVGGATDLFVVEMASGARRRLTDDLQADLQPTWSPDGRRIAFVTDRFGTRISDLTYGHERLALIDAEGGTITPVPGFEDAKNINPQWSADGWSLFFISDHGGISNIYRVALDGGAITQNTDLVSGASGITRLSPAFSVARTTERMVASIYDAGRYDLYAIEGAEALAGRPPRASLEGARAATLPPVERTSAEVIELRHDSALGLPSTAGFERKPYRAGLGLDHISQGSVGIANGANGVAVGGGVTLHWSDMLGDHNLATLLQVSNYGGSFVNNLAGVAQYVNRRSRWQWGLAAGQLPYVSRQIEVEETTIGGRPVVIERDARAWEIDRDLQASAAYPFSSVQRLELGVGFRNISFPAELETRVIDAFTGELLEDVTVSQDSLPSLQMATGDVALVYDSSIFGGTSPILGQRFRLELSPVVGDVQFMGVLGDYRRYVMLLRPLNLAGRVLHYGRYGNGSEDARLGPVFIGYPWLVRGYDVTSFTIDECGGDPNCPALNRLLGSRAGIGNLELRLPLFGAAGVVRSPAVPPIEVAGFFDAGAAWTREEKASFLGGPRDVVTSHGIALRVNLLGFAVGEVDFVHPNDRPQRGWYWIFSLQPGF